MENLTQKQKKLLYIAVGVAGLILILGGLTFFISKNDKEKVNLDIKYKDGDSITVKDIEDKWETTKTITVKNKTSKTKTYDLVWSKASNSFNIQSDLLYSISSEGKGVKELGTSQIPVAASPIFKDVKIDSGETHSYKMKVWYKQSNKAKSEKDSEFNGTLKVKVKKDNK